MWHDVDMLTMNKIKILPDISCYVHLLSCIIYQNNFRDSWILKCNLNFLLFDLDAYKYLQIVLVIDIGNR